MVSGFMKLIFVLSTLLLIAVGCDTSGQKVADAEVQRLCKIDGGVKVYETVKLPSGKFNEWGQINFYRPDQGEDALGPEFIFIHEAKWLRKSSMEPSHDLTLLRDYYAVKRRVDGKLLGTSVRYGRGGGDIPGPWHPSSYSCPSNDTVGSNVLLKKVFVPIGN